MAKFKCLLSGNVFKFDYEWDVEEMRLHPQYEEIEDDLQIEEKQNTKEKVKKYSKAKGTK